MVTAAKAIPIQATKPLMTKNANSDQVRRWNGSRRMVRLIRPTWSLRSLVMSSSDTVTVLLLPPTGGWKRAAPSSA